RVTYLYEHLGLSHKRKILTRPGGGACRAGNHWRILGKLREASAAHPEAETPSSGQGKHMHLRLNPHLGKSAVPARRTLHSIKTTAALPIQHKPSYFQAGETRSGRSPEKHTARYI